MKDFIVINKLWVLRSLLIWKKVLSKAYEASLGAPQASKMKNFETIVNGS